MQSIISGLTITACICTLLTKDLFMVLWPREIFLLNCFAIYPYNVEGISDWRIWCSQYICGKPCLGLLSDNSLICKAFHTSNYLANPQLLHTFCEFIVLHANSYIGTSTSKRRLYQSYQNLPSTTLTDCWEGPQYITQGLGGWDLLEVLLGCTSFFNFIAKAYATWAPVTLFPVPA